MVKKAVDLVEDENMSPTDAIAKIAKDNNLSPERTKLLVNAYNIGKTAYYRREGKTASEKLKEFPIAIYEDVSKQVFGEVKKASDIDRVYTDKVASDLLIESLNDEYFSSLEKQLEKTAQKQEPTPTVPDLTETQKKVAAALIAFRTSLDPEGNKIYERIGFPRLENNLIKKAAENPAIALHSFMDKYRQWGEEVRVRLSHRLTKLGFKRENIAKERKIAAAVEKLANEAISALRKDAGIDKDSEQEKQASEDDTILCKKGSFPMFAWLTGLLASKATSATKKDVAKAEEKELKSDILDDLVDPEYIEAREKVEAQKRLAQLMSNPLIANSNKEEVARAMNLLSTLAPTAARNPLIAETMVIKYLGQGMFEPYDLQMLASIENHLKQTRTAYPGTVSVENPIASKTDKKPDTPPVGEDILAMSSIAPKGK